MRKNKFLGSILFCFLFVCNYSSGQPVQADSSFKERSARRLTDMYHQAINRQAGLYNGIEYIPIDFYVTGHPFFESDVAEDGSVEYDGVLYHDIPILFDILKDEVIIEHYDGVYYIQLHKKRINHFSLSGHNFVRIDQDNLQNPSLQPGFYDLLYDGKVKVLARRTKTIQQAPGKTAKTFLKRNYYFLQKEGEYYPVKSKRSIIKVFNEHKKPLQKYLRENKINFKEAYEPTVVKLAAYYDQLVN